MHVVAWSSASWAMNARPPPSTSYTRRTNDPARILSALDDPRDAVLLPVPRGDEEKAWPDALSKVSDQTVSRSRS